MILGLQGLVRARWWQACDGLPQTGSLAGLVAVITAGGAGAVMPLPLVVAALGAMPALEGSTPDRQTAPAAELIPVTEPVSVPVVRDLLVRLGSLVTRSRPGRPDERAGLAHPLLVNLFDPPTGTPAAGLPGEGARAGGALAGVVEDLPVQAAHAALAALIDDQVTGRPRVPVVSGLAGAVRDYAEHAGPVHHLRLADVTGAVKVLNWLDGPRPGQNRDRWATWLPAITALAGPDHPATLTTRHNLASWRGEAGDPAGAAAGFGDLLPEMLRVLGPDHPATLTTRHNLALWRGEAGAPAGAAAGFADLLPESLRVLGPDHPDTLTTRHNLAYWRGQ
ncbi:MAG TPA: tetratricopeptide repeat protein, partial [Frankiaceae bacterium]|nr:tetratricopeptide repeat protein [Frankiaceae bacterium]